MPRLWYPLPSRPAAPGRHIPMSDPRSVERQTWVASPLMAQRKPTSTAPWSSHDRCPTAAKAPAWLRGTPPHTTYPVRIDVEVHSHKRQKPRAPTRLKPTPGPAPAAAIAHSSTVGSRKPLAAAKAAASSGERPTAGSSSLPSTKRAGRGLPVRCSQSLTAPHVTRSRSMAKAPAPAEASRSCRAHRG